MSAVGATAQRSSNYRLLGWVLCVSIVTAMFGKPLYEGGKIALSNVAQIALFLLLVWRLPKLSFGQGAIIAVISTTSMLAWFYTTFSYGFFGKPIILVFMLVSLTYLFVFSNLIGTFKFSGDEFAVFIRGAVYCCAIIYPLFFIQEALVANGIYLGMDDKSHSSIYLSFLSFLSLRYIGRWKFFFCFYFFFISLLSISRLAFIFAPFLLMMVLGLVATSPGWAIKIKTLILMLTVSVIGTILVLDNPTYFQVFERVSSAEAISESESSAAHKMLLDKGVELKMSDIGLFLLGTSPGSFADILVRSSVSYSDLSALDPQFIEYAWQGRAPIHSTHMAFFVEYSILVFALYVGYFFWTCWRLWRNRELMLCMFLIPFAGATLFYSAHNKFYFFVILAVVELILRSPVSLKQARTEKMLRTPLEAGKPGMVAGHA